MGDGKKAIGRKTNIDVNKYISESICNAWMGFVGVGCLASERKADEAI